VLSWQLSITMEATLRDHIRLPIWPKSKTGRASRYGGDESGTGNSCDSVFGAAHNLTDLAGRCLKVPHCAATFDSFDDAAQLAVI
jgi:hypothetical protein